MNDLAKVKGGKILNTLLAATVIAIAFSGCDMQNSFLYFPDPVRPSERSLASDGLMFWLPSGDGYRGITGSKEIRSPKGTVVVFHGNAGRAADRVFYVRALGALGYRVILAEYPGYGGRAGTPGEKVFVKDALDTLRLAVERYGGPVYVLGESLGCGVAAAAVGDGSVQADGIVLITPWDSLTSVAKSKAPAFIVKLLLKDRYDNIANLRSFRKKIAVVAAERDDLIPVSHAETLYNSLPGDKRMWTVKGAGHNDWPFIVGPGWFREIMDYIAN